jgi:hypothetical protein
VPVAAKLVVHDAVRELPEPVSGIAVQPAIELPFLVEATLPVGLVPVTVAVKVTFWLTLAGLSELTSVVPGGGALPAVQASISVISSTCGGARNRVQRGRGREG